MLPKTVEYALRVAYWLARTPDAPASADRLAEVTHIPRRYLHKVVQGLVRAGVVRSQPGPGGGYAFDRSPEATSILDVVNAVSPLERIKVCPLGLSSHSELCPLHKELDGAFAATEKAFARVSLAQLLRSGGTVTPLCEARESTDVMPRMKPSRLRTKSTGRRAQTRPARGR